MAAELSVFKQKLTVTKWEFAANGSKGYLKFRFSFDSTWNDYVKSVIFYSGTSPIIKARTLITDNECIVPHKVLNGNYICFACIGETTDGRRITTNGVKKELAHSGYIEYIDDDDFFNRVEADSALSKSSENPVQNKIVTEELNRLEDDKVSRDEYATEIKAGIVTLHRGGSGNNSGLLVGTKGELAVNVSPDGRFGLTRDGVGQIKTYPATEADIVSGTDAYKPIVPKMLKNAVESVAGKSAELSTSDKTNLVSAINELVKKIGDIVVTVDSELSSSSENPIQNKVIAEALNKKIPFEIMYEKPTEAIEPMNFPEIAICGRDMYICTEKNLMSGKYVWEKILTADFTSNGFDGIDDLTSSVKSLNEGAYSNGYAGLEEITADVISLVEQNKKGNFKSLTVTDTSSTDAEINEPLKVRNNRIDVFKKTTTDSDGTAHASSFLKIDNSKKQITIDADKGGADAQVKLSGMNIVGDKHTTISGINEISVKKISIKEGASNDELTDYAIEPGQMGIGSYVGVGGVRYPTAVLEWCRNGSGSSSQDNRSMEFKDGAVRIAIDETGSKFSIEAPQFNLCRESQNPLIETSSSDSSNLKLRSGAPGEAGSVSSISFKGNNIRICGDIEIFCPDDNCSELQIDATQEEKDFLNGYLLNKLIELRREIRQTQTLSRYSAAPQKVGEWIDGTPIWRIAFKKNFTADELVDKSVLISDLFSVNDPNVAFVVDYCVNLFFTEPCMIDDIALKISSCAISFDLDTNITPGETDGIYGWIEFATPENNLTVTAQN